MWCEADCKALNTFRVDEWPRSDAFLLVTICIFVVARKVRQGIRARGHEGK